ncbi:hypothetical protein JX265_009204 [Neoarthrinium moseri]|uniref:Fcf2 pre-rRNA processing C-terminal domain-containing protein n=1 Tax=Neoarthrinium moseri TaxID=1658444 RepID=A0A9P9WGS4_9PEZI|nr:uncharacterized protein JN550_006630 [Neoarthrinium moseri]KAI1847776.1 hypothetical protein JX266_006271 [Neoarthrinium moseri]KAI1862490.1 hypothetical protein JX265_009204 [Neoarthrinium moseri]KAI1868142.1 hypothetical protein JN550_006630 [Neoarthrinium moseri]
MAEADAVVDLTDGDVERLLKEAEARLSAKASSQNGKSLTIPSNMEVKQAGTQPTPDATTAPAADDSKAKAEELSVRVPKPRLSNKEFVQQTKASAGSAWYNLPKTDLTPGLARDLKLLKMRNVLDPKRFYKKDSSKASVPEFSQVGTIVEGPTEYFSARMTKKERKRTLLEEVMETEASNRKFKSKYGEIQAAKTSGKKGYYKKMTQKRYGKK